MNEIEETQLLQTELFNKVLLNRIEQQRDKIRQLKIRNHSQKQEIDKLKKLKKRDYLRDSFAFLITVSTVVFVVLVIYKSFFVN